MRTELGSWRRAWRRVGKVGKAEVEVEEAEARRRARRTASRGGGGRGGGRACALIKSNNPHLAGGEKHAKSYPVSLFACHKFNPLGYGRTALQPWSSGVGLKMNYP